MYQKNHILRQYYTNNRNYGTFTCGVPVTQNTIFEYTSIKNMENSVVQAFV